MSRIHEYQEFCKTVWNDTPSEEMQLCNALMGLCGEAGELTDLFKKTIHHGHSTDMVKAVKEIGDVAYYLTTVCNILGVSLETVLIINEEKLRKRYPNGFSTEASIERKEVK